MGLERWHFASARELFEATYAASMEADRTNRSLEQMRQRCGLHGQSFEPSVRSGSIHDVMAPVDALIDREKMLMDRLSDDQELISVALEVIYGSGNGNGGICALMGSQFADVLCWRYCEALKWSAVAQRAGVCVRTCQSYADAAMETMDSYGWRRVASGEGLAT